jgi:hypothetical protein
MIVAILGTKKIRTQYMYLGILGTFLNIIQQNTFFT